MDIRPDPSFDDYHRRWLGAYERNNYDNSLSGSVLTRTHDLIERDLDPDQHISQVLEVGAGTGVHLAFVRHEFDRYVMTDHSATTLERAEIPAALRPKVEFDTVDAAKLHYPDDSFDRVIATHVLEHMQNPHAVIREWCRVLRPGGVLSLILPCDPGLAWRIGRYFGPRKKATGSGIDYDYWMAREHVNSINNLVTFVRFYFDDRRERWWPLPFIGLPDINLIYAVNARPGPREDPKS